MPTIWKFPVRNHGRNEILVPKKAKILHVALQDEQIHVWARVDPRAPKVTRQFFVLATGEVFDENLQLKHIGTVHSHFGFVWHVFDGGEVEG